MENSTYNSLTQKLIQNGIIQSENDNSSNFFEVANDNPIVEEQAQKAEEPTTKVCPYCFTEINIHATRCPHCTSELKEEK